MFVGLDEKTKQKTKKLVIIITADFRSSKNLMTPSP